jgi:hypothetical protein
MEDTAEWVLDILGSAAVVLLTKGKLHSVATEWAFELKEGLPSINISTKMLMKHLSKENRIGFFKVVRNAMKNSFIKWDDEDSLINDEAGIAVPATINDENSFYVLKRISDTTIMILVK